MNRLPVFNPIELESFAKCMVCGHLPFSHLKEVSDTHVSFQTACNCAAVRRTVKDWAFRWTLTMEAK